jgi:PAS domain S-box-containing protein
MKASFSIAKKIWLSLAILVSGYLISMIAGFILGQNTELRLRYVSEYLFPASRQSQIALSSFEEEIRLYNNAVLTGESSFIESAASKAEEVRQSLEVIISLKDFDAEKKKEVKAVLGFLYDFNLLAQDTYTKLSSAFEEKEDSPEDTKDKDLEEKAFYLARTTKMIQGRLAYFSDAYADNLKTELSDVSNTIRRQRYMNMLIFFGVVIVTLSLIAIIIRRSIIRPLMRIVNIAEDITAGKEDIQWLPETHNEIGILNTSLRTMTENLKTAEKKYRNIFNNAVEGIFQIRPDGSVVNLNSSMAKIIGYNSPEELLASGYKITDQTYVNPEHRRQIFDIMNREGIIIGFETQLLRKDNTAVWVSLSARLVKDGGGKALYAEGSAIDITEHKEKEKAELERQIAEEANKKIMSSIQYAKSIQDSLLPNISEVKKFLPESFFIWEPRDIVGGDIFFAERLEDGFIIAVVDCTGHGVPGAFMTMIASSGLRKIIRDEGCHDPAEILKLLNYFVKKTLRQDTDYALSDDGLDAGICFVTRKPESQFSILNSQFSLLTFSGAKLPLFYIYNNELTVIKGDRQSIGYKRSDLNFDFTEHRISIESGMFFYLFTDGFADQMGGGEKRRRLGTPRLKEILQENAAADFEKQKELLLEAFYSHKGKGERQDDVTGIGFGF